MPIKLVAGRHKGAKSIWLRGTHLGVAVDRSSKTSKRPVARRIRDELEAAIERGEFPARAEAPASGEQPTFLSAALAYLKAGKRRRYVNRLIRHFGEKPLSEFSQAVIDEAAAALCPDCTGGARNAAVYTPVSAILHHTLGKRLPFDLERPKGAKGRVVTDWLVEADAFGIIAAADDFDPEFGVLLRFLLYTGVRIGAAVRLQREDLRLEEARAWVRHQKGQPAADVRLHQDLRKALATLLATHDNRRVFRFHKAATSSTSSSARSSPISACPVLCAPAGDGARRQPTRLGDLPFVPPHLGDMDAPARRHRGRSGGQPQLARSAHRWPLRARRRGRCLGSRGSIPEHGENPGKGTMSNAMSLIYLDVAMLSPRSGPHLFKSPETPISRGFSRPSLSIGDGTERETYVPRRGKSGEFEHDSFASPLLH
jgi:hypothetical protein